MLTVQSVIAVSDNESIILCSMLTVQSIIGVSDNESMYLVPYAICTVSYMMYPIIRTLSCALC